MRSILPACLVLVLAVSSAACSEDSGSGGQPSASSTPAADHNAADVTFASEMILHHQQAAQMVSMAGYQASTPSVKQLATAMNAAQDAEIKQLSTWLTSWGSAVPSQSHSHEETMPGTLSQEELSDLGSAKGKTFDRMWIELMIRHHQGTVTMAKAHQTAGRHPAAVALAKKVEIAQTKEIAAMRQVLSRLAGS